MFDLAEVFERGERADDAVFVKTEAPVGAAEIGAIARR